MVDSLEPVATNEELRTMSGEEYWNRYGRTELQTLRNERATAALVSVVQMNEGKIGPLTSKSLTHDIHANGNGGIS